MATTNEQVTAIASAAQEATPMKARFVALALIPLALAAAPAPAGNDNHGCGVVQTSDSGMRAKFAAFDRGQSVAANKICAIYLNNSNLALSLD
jgi:hypothetical protein